MSHARHTGGKHEEMHSPGATRPRMNHSEQVSKESEQEQEGGTHVHHQTMMSPDERQHMLRQHHARTIWIYWLLFMLGIWMILSPLTFDYGKGTVSPAGGRELWLSLTDRITIMKWSDILSGLVLLVFGWRSLKPNRPVSVWIMCLVGIWITIAPVIFWAPTAAAYLNGTLVGALVIALSILIPGMPNMLLYMKMGAEVPAGWSYNPSSWPQRWIMIGLGFAGWMVSRALAAYQLGYIDTVWDPFFGTDTLQVLDSDMSHMWPVSDGALGATAYTLEFLMGWMGSPARWRTMPWMVTFFGILVIPLGLVHIFLVISQPVIVGHWCTLCLLAALIMLPMIPLEIDEVVAMGQFLVKARRKGQPFWKTFWKGGAADGEGKDDRSPALEVFPDAPLAVFRASVWGMSVPWTLAVSTVLGAGLMAAPGLLDIMKPASTVYHLGGALIVVTSVLSMGEVIRAVRYLNILLGTAVAVLPWLLEGSSIIGHFIGLIAGLAVAGLAWPQGPKKESYGSWDKYVI